MKTLFQPVAETMSRTPNWFEGGLSSRRPRKIIEEVAVGASSGQFALNFGARNATDVRTELGARADKTWQLADTSPLNLSGKATWAHDAVSDPQLSASFIGLTPIASFAASGATPSHDLALLSGGAEWRLASGFSLVAKFDSELSGRTTTYAGTGRLRYTW